MLALKRAHNKSLLCFVTNQSLFINQNARLSLAAARTASFCPGAALRMSENATAGTCNAVTSVEEQVMPPKLTEYKETSPYQKIIELHFQQDITSPLSSISIL